MTRRFARAPVSQLLIAALHLTASLAVTGHLSACGQSTSAATGPIASDSGVAADGQATSDVPPVDSTIADAALDASDTSAATSPETSDATVPLDSASPPTCDDYCATVQAACTGKAAQYASVAECRSVCKNVGRWPSGTRGDVKGNTVACRLTQAEAASTLAGDPAATCAAAGRTGANVCGTWCDNYCALVLGSCLGDASLFGNAAECQSACEKHPADGLVGDADGDSVQCRLYHAGVAASDPPASALDHCPHAGPSGDGVCVPKSQGPTCQSYCFKVTAACKDTNAQYASQAACEAYCATWAGWDQGGAGDENGNTIGCRQYWAGQADGSAKAATECVLAGPTGGGSCGSWCDNYCWLAQRNCTDTNTLYSGSADCKATCATFPKTGKPGDTDGDTVQCRVYHLGVAGSDKPASADQHCAHGGKSGAAICVD